MSCKPQAIIELELSLSQNILSLSQPSQTFVVHVTAKTISSSKPESDIIFNARWTVLDDRLVAYRYPFRLKSVNEPESFIRLSPAVSISASRPPAEPDLRKNELERFLAVPGVGKGELVVEHNLSVKRIFEFSDIKPSDIKAGSEYRFEVHDRSMPPQWWTFGDEAEGKRFREGVRPDENENIEETERLESEGWMYSYPVSDCRFVIKTEPMAVLRFVE